MQILSSTHDVVVTWVNDSSSVWLQRTADQSLEQNLLDSLYGYYSVKKEQIVPEENEVYAALAGDGNWYRVKVLKIIDGLARINLIDYGNVEDVPFENIRTLEAQFYLPHQLGIEVSLPVSLAGNDDEQRKVLNPLLDGKVFSATFYNLNRKWIAELSENGEKLSDKLASNAVVSKTTKTQFEGVELADMVVGEKYNVVASHVDNPNQLWLQRSEELNAISELQNQLQEGSSLYLDYDGVPEEKSLCLAMYSFDKLWYRAEVLDADDDITTVRFIDYGNTDVIENNKGMLKQLPEKWKSVKKYAIQCKLDVVPQNGDDWTEDACARISDLVMEKPMQALIITDKPPLRVDLFVEGQSSCKLLVDEKLAAYLQSPEEFVEEIIEEMPLDPRSAFVSCVISVDQFWMQEDKMVNDLEMLGDRLVMASMLPPVAEITDGMLCIARFPDDNLYYRATVLEQTEEGTKVRYLDYGNVAVTNDLRTIPNDIADISPLAKKCKLAKPDGVEHWPHGINEEFNKLAADGATIFLLDIIEEGETNLVKLTHENKDVAMELLEQCKLRHTKLEDEGIVIEETKNLIVEERPSPIGEEGCLIGDDICGVSYVNSPSDFWVQMKSQFGTLEQISEKLVKAELFDAVEDISEGKILAAKFHEDNLWYRSKVLSHCKENGTEVLYIDYGNSALTTDPNTSLRVLPEDLAQIPPIAVFCSLRKPKGVETWSKSACEKFINLVANGETEFRLKALNKNSNAEQLEVELRLEDQDVSEILLSCQNDAMPSTEQNSSGDSAVVVEEQQAKLEENIKDNSSNASAALEELSGSVEIVHDMRLCSTEIELEEAVITSENEASSTGTKKNDSEQGCALQDVSQEGAPCGTSSPTSKTVPPSVDTTIDEDDLVIKDDAVETPVQTADTPANSTTSQEDNPKEETMPIDVDNPSTLKTTHDEKILASAVNAQLIDEDTVVIDDDIPKKPSDD